MKIKIKNFTISKDSKPFIIAEMSGNHGQSLNKAYRIIDAAYKSGANAIKLQTYTPETITMDVKKKEFFITDKKNPWKRNSLHSLYKKAHTPWSWHKNIFDYCKKKKIICFSSPFDNTAVDFLEKFNPPMYKIASFENNHYPLIKRVIETKKPIIISLGMITEKELNNLIKFLKKNKCKKFILLKCTSSYPSNPEDLNIKTIIDIKKKYKCITGLSDHSIGIGAAVCAISLGGTVIEKHFMLSKKENTVDSAFSSDPKEFELLTKEALNAWKSIGKIKYGSSSDEKKYRKFKRSIYVSKDIKKGEIFTKENLKIVRPGHGLHPKFYFTIMGKKAKKNLKFGTALKSTYI
jgi:pseudaminic acid synthase